MDLYKEPLAKECAAVLQKVKTVIEDDSLTDDARFLKIEGIVEVFEDLCARGGKRRISD